MKKTRIVDWIPISGARREVVIHTLRDLRFDANYRIEVDDSDFVDELTSTASAILLKYA